LSEAIAAFAAANPQLTMSLDLGDFTFGTYDFVERGFDLSIKFSPLVSSNLVARRIGALRLVLCASPEYLSRRGEPSTPKEVATHRYLWHSDPNIEDQTLNLVGPNGPVAIKLRPSFRSNSAIVLRDAALAGLGIATLPLFVVNDDLQRGGLRRVLKKYVIASHDVYAVHPHRGLVPKKIKLFVDYLVAWLAAQSKKKNW
jgi:DNA-binding transcriptional LysR family regulator